MQYAVRKLDDFLSFLIVSSIRQQFLILMNLIHCPYFVERSFERSSKFNFFYLRNVLLGPVTFLLMTLSHAGKGREAGGEGGATASKPQLQRPFLSKHEL